MGFPPVPSPLVPPFPSLALLHLVECCSPICDKAPRGRGTRLSTEWWQRCGTGDHIVFHGAARNKSAAGWYDRACRRVALAMTPSPGPVSDRGSPSDGLV